jgi:hypothetical protein
MVDIPDEPSYEICECRLKELVPFKKGLFGFGRRKATSVFVAVATGPDGEHEVGRSSPFELSYLIWDVEYGYASEKLPSTQNAFRELTKKLAEDGWELAGSNSKWWWNKTFRREIA